MSTEPNPPVEPPPLPSMEAEPTPIEPPPVPPVRRWVSLSLFFTCVIWLTQPLWAPPVMKALGRQAQPRAAVGDDMAALQVVYLGRVQIGLGSFGGGDALPDFIREQRDQQMNEVAGQLRALAADELRPAGVRAFLILFTHLDWPEADAMRARYAAMDAPGGGPGTGREAALRRLYLDGRPLDAAGLGEINAQPGFLSDLATLHSLRLNADPRAAELEARIQSAARRTVTALAVGLWAVLAGMLGGIVILARFTRNAILRNFRRGMADSRIPPQVSFEAFTFYLLLMSLAPLLLPRGAAGGMLATAFMTPVIFVLAVSYPLTQSAAPGLRVRWPALRADLGLFAGPSAAREVLSGLAGYLAALPLIGVALVLTQLVARHTGLDEQSGIHPVVPALRGDSPLFVRAAIILLAVVVAPLTEEILFRGFFYRFLRSRHDAPNSVFISAALFAGIHPQGMMGFFPLLAIGAVLAVLREWRGSIIAPVVMHACVNGVTLGLVTVMF